MNNQTINADELELCMQALANPSIIHHAASEGLTPKTFMSPLGSLLWTEIRECDQKYPIDAPTLVRHLKHKGLWDKLEEHIKGALDTDNFGNPDQLIEQIRERYTEDTVLSLLRRAKTMNEDREPSTEIISFLIDELPKLLTSRSEDVDIEALVREEVNSERKLRSRFMMIDNTTDYDGLIVIAGRPSDGKTTFTLNEAEMWSRTNRVDFFSLEMPERQVYSKVAAYKANVNFHRIKRGMATPEELARFYASVKELQSQHLVVHDDKPTFKTLMSKLMGVIVNGGSTCVIIDYLQLINATNEERRMGANEYLNQWTSGLKGLWKRTGVPVFALSQMSRLGNKQITTTPPIPTLESLRGSGGIEQDADVVVILSKKPGLEISMFQGGDKMDWPMIAALAKSRNGPTDVFEFLFKRDRQAYIDPNTNYPSDW